MASHIVALVRAVMRGCLLRRAVVRRRAVMRVALVRRAGVLWHAVMNVAWLMPTVLMLAVTSVPLGAQEMASSLSEQEMASSLRAQEVEPRVEFYGFIRNYAVMDSREGWGAAEDFFYVGPKDIKLNQEGEDINAHTSFKFSSISSRLGLNVLGYRYRNWDMSARLEFDFYTGLSSTPDDPVTRTSMTGTASCRFRHGYVSVKNGNLSIKAGQTLHPIANVPEVAAMNTGVPFLPLCRLPQVCADYRLGNGVTLTAAALWHMQFASAGPYGQSANYIRNGGGDWFLGLAYASGPFTAKTGADILSITPRVVDAKGLKVNEHITTAHVFAMLQYKRGIVSARAMSTYGSAGEHLNLNGAYGVTADSDINGQWHYTPAINSSNWASLTVRPGNWQFVSFAGYAKNLGTRKAVLDADHLYCHKFTAKNMNSMWRYTQDAVYNQGKLALGLEYEVTTIRYGDMSLGMNTKKALFDQGLHNVTNHRILTIVRFNF